ncbi:hypothetical protein EG328_005620 [Venturia inaequalis]|uniref:Prolyl 4-hydroxylase alpha subunit domain-containing protein n=1 Tax=Venturia inaequalis TaxID=5025 RepID=A0A8H3VHI8_VENIN|nr:hypothetical protein EG328_005620 [Venturia inaequalis]
MAPSLRTIIEYAFISIPVYLFVLSPLLKTIAPSLFSDTTSITYQSFELSDSLVIPNDNLTCPPHKFNVRILNRAPLIVYIDGFLSEKETTHLLNEANATYKPSTIFTGTEESFDATVRNSSKALLPRDKTVQCIESRAREFQGWQPDVYIERLWAQKYNAGGHYTYHFDWSGDLGRRRGGRISTFMVYLDDECTGGGTKFPRLRKPKGEAWCGVLDCGDAEGVTFKPVRGNAVYWENYGADGKGFEETWHAGLPVESGVKVGLNIWSYILPGYTESLERQAISQEL